MRVRIHICVYIRDMCIPIHLSIFPSTYLPIYRCICVSMYLSTYLSIALEIYRFACRCFVACVHMYIQIHISVCTYCVRTYVRIHLLPLPTATPGTILRACVRQECSVRALKALHAGALHRLPKLPPMQDRADFEPCA